LLINLPISPSAEKKLTGRHKNVAADDISHTVHGGRPLIVRHGKYREKNRGTRWYCDGTFAITSADSPAASCLTLSARSVQNFAVRYPAVARKRGRHWDIFDGYAEFI